LCLQPEELLHHLDELEAAEQGREVRIKGYKVKVQYQPIGEEVSVVYRIRAVDTRRGITGISSAEKKR